MSLCMKGNPPPYTQATFYPTNTSSQSSTSPSWENSLSTINFSSTNLGSVAGPGGSNKKMKLTSNAQEKIQFDRYANLFSIIKTTEAIEDAYSAGRIPQDIYQKECANLITQFKNVQEVLSHGTDSQEFINKFMEEYKIATTCKLAYKRLVEVGKPITPGGGKKAIAETTQCFITFKDALELNVIAVDQLHPWLKELVDSFANSSANFEGIEICVQWLETLSKMKASDQLDENQIRQLKFDIETAYNNFYKSLG